jgi:4-diphosphocytidyl-2C-methyl-D-erythritol kinase
VKRYCSTVLMMEAIVIALAIPIAIHIDHLTPHTAVLTGGIAAVAAVLLAVLVRWQLRVTVVLLQLYLVASGQIVPVMYFLGAVFAAFWAGGIWLARREERAAGH